MRAFSLPKQINNRQTTGKFRKNVKESNTQNNTFKKNLYEKKPIPIQANITDTELWGKLCLIRPRPIFWAVCVAQLITTY